MSGEPANRNALGAVLLSTSWIFFTTEMIAVRLLSDDLSIAQIAVFRQGTQVVIFIPILVVMGSRLLRTERLKLHVLRGFCSMGGMVLFYLAFALLPVALATTLTFTQAMFLTVLAVVLLGERVGLRRTMAVAVGLVGVIIVMRPGVGDFSPASLIALAGAFVAALLFIVTRQLSATDSRLTIMMYSALFGLVVVLVPALFDWRPIRPEHWWLLGLVGLCGTFGQFLMVGALQLSEASALAPVDYVRLVFAIIGGYIVFGEIPSMWTWIGAIVIVASAIYTTHRERQIARTQTLERRAS